MGCSWVLPAKVEKEAAEAPVLQVLLQHWEACAPAALEMVVDSSASDSEQELLSTKLNMQAMLLE